MSRRIWWLVVAGLVILGAPIAWYLGSPLFINKTVNEPFPAVSGSDEAFPMSKGATVPEGMTHQQVEAVMMQASKLTTTMSELQPGEATSATVEARGTLVAADTFHKGEGSATVYHAGRDLILRLDPFQVTNGPDLHVILTKQSAPKTRADVEQGYVEVAKLKGNVGGQNYTLPHEVRLNEYHAVVIYCKMFHVVFSTAILQPPR